MLFKQLLEVLYLNVDKFNIYVDGQKKEYESNYKMVEECKDLKVQRVAPECKFKSMTFEGEVITTPMLRVYLKTEKD